MSYTPVMTTDKKGLRVSVRADEKQKLRLKMVQEDLSYKGTVPTESDIIRSILGWGRRDLVSPEQRAFIAGDIDSLHGPFAPKRNKV